jgi:hypothetical protein
MGNIIAFFYDARKYLRCHPSDEGQSPGALAVRPTVR